MLTKKWLSNSNIILSHFKSEDKERLIQFFADELLMRHFDALPARSKSEDELETWLKNSSDSTVRFAIRLQKTNELIGFIELDGILWTHRSSWVSIFIGDENQRGNGYGKEAMNLMIQFAFNELNLHRIQLTVFAYNDVAIKLYETLGFKKEGSYREFIERDGQRYDMLLYGLLREEWRAR